MVTAELAVALPTVVLVAALAVTFLSVFLAQLRALDAAAVAARLVARGEPAPAVAAEVSATAGAATLRLLDTAAAPSVVVAQVTVRVRLPVLGRVLPVFVVRERAAAPREPGAGALGAGGRP